MFTFQPINATYTAQKIFNSMTTDAWDESDWSPTQAFKPGLAFILALLMALCILAYPENHRRLKIAIFLLPISYACWYHALVSPFTSICDTFGRFMYIWFARMSHEVILLEWTPPVTKANDNARTRFQIALKVLYAREPEGDVLHPTPRHAHSRAYFLAYHAAKALFYYFLQCAYTVLAREMIHAHRSDLLIHERGTFFRRLPDSLDAAELWERFDTVVVWCVLNLWLYDAFHSLSALFFVGLRFDAPAEWSMSLFGPLAGAWSVRRYWGKHWHNYIYLSFSSHAKVVTRGWLGMRRGCVATRLLENTMVFAASGVMHTLIRWIQSGSEGGDCWVIALWYTGQMVPIVLEDLVQRAWRARKRELGIKDAVWLLRAERVVGYFWVFAFNAWSIPKYYYTKQAWAYEARRRRYVAFMEERERERMSWEMPVETKVEL